MGGYRRWSRNDFQGGSLAAVVGLVCVAALALPAPALAAFPGANGKIVFSESDGADREIYTMNLDASGQTPVTSNSTHDTAPRWSADGKKIVFATNRDGDYEIFVMNADGSGETRVTNNSVSDGNPAWSPYGSRIAFVSSRDGNNEIYLIDPDGSGETRLTNHPASDVDPVWSPNGTKIAFVSDRGGASSFYTGIYTMNPDGTGITNVPSGTQHVSCLDATAQSGPDWSPDGQRLAFADYEADFLCDETSWRSINSIKADGTDEVVLYADVYACCPAFSPTGFIAYVCGDGNHCVGSTSYGQNGQSDMDWQPILPTQTGYARPVSATPTSVTLVPAFKTCSSANGSHGPPLTAASCNLPQLTSDHLTVGTGDANGAASNSSGSVTLRVFCHPPDQNGLPECPDPGDQIDVGLTASLTDVRNKIGLTDHTGELRVSVNTRITDRFNLPGGVTRATVSDTPLAFNLTCHSTDAEAIGSTCSAATSADAVVPGIALENKRAIWELGQVQVYDGGADDDADTTGDNTLFAVQGLFTP